MEEDSKLENILRNGSLIIGILLLIASIQLSYDGFDQKVSGGNSEYTLMAMAIGYTLAIAFSLLEFIVSSKLEGLNTTLKILGVVAYVYSIWTNFLGFQAILHMDKAFALISAFALDVIPEPMIAWGLGEAVMHDLFKNLGSIATSSPASKRKNKGGGGQQQQQNFHQQNSQNHQKGGGGDRREPSYRFDGVNKGGGGASQSSSKMSPDRYNSVIEQLRKEGKIQ